MASRVQDAPSDMLRREQADEYAGLVEKRETCSSKRASTALATWSKSRCTAPVTPRKHSPCKNLLGRLWMSIYADEAAGAREVGTQRLPGAFALTLRFLR
jgi:hypothetical protein